MLKKMSIKKIMITSITVLVLLMLYLIPTEEKEASLKEEKLEYVYSNDLAPIYLLDSNDYVAMTTISSCQCKGADKAKNLLEGLIIEGSKNSIIPNGFRSIIPSGTTVKDVSLDNNILTIDFSKDILEINKEYEEKMIEALVYTLTSIDGIDKLIIKVEGEVLTKLPNSGKELPSPLDKSYGVNKKYDLTTTKDISSYTLYYVNKYNDNNYYVPITKYVNGNSDDKIKVIIEELSYAPMLENKLMSYLNVDTKLIDYQQNDNKLSLNFDSNIYSSSEKKEIDKQVINTIGLSMTNQYNVDEVIFLVENKEISTFSEKNIE